MSEVTTDNIIHIYYAKCPICSKAYVSLSKHQLFTNLRAHFRVHKAEDKIEQIKYEHRIVILEEEGQ